MPAALPVAPKPMAARKGHKRPMFVGGRQVIAEPARIVGKSGREYTTLSEDGPEMITIVPLTRAYAPKVEKGKQRALTGDQLIALGITPDQFDPNDPNLASKLAALNAAQTPQQAAAVTNPQNYGAAGVQQYQAQQQVNQARQGVISAQAGVQRASQGQIEASRAAIEAARRAQQQQGTALEATLAYLRQQERAAQEAEREERAIQEAALDVADQAAVAAARAARADLDYKFDLAGVSRPQEVTVDRNRVLPPGVRPKLETREEILTRDAQRAGALREFEVERARIASSRASTQATAAGNVAELADIEARAAGLNVSAANLGLNAARLSLDQAELERDISRQPPAPGLVFDDETGEWVSASELRLRQAGRNVIVNQRTGQVLGTRDQLDADGNIVDPRTGILTDPRTGNQFINGVWTDPATGNRYLPDPVNPSVTTWIAPNGDVLRGNLWWSPTFGGYLRTDGSYYNPVTGQVLFRGEIFNDDPAYMSSRNRSDPISAAIAAALASQGLPTGN